MCLHLGLNQINKINWQGCPVGIHLCGKRRGRGMDVLRCYTNKIEKMNWGG